MSAAARLGLALAASLSGAAAAQEAGGDEQARSELNTAMAHIQFALCADDKPCEAASAAELADPPLKLAEAKAVLRRGVLSGAAKACGMDWQKVSFLPMMSRWRAMHKSERQMALIGILHGMAQAQAEAVMGAEPCNDAMRQNIRALLSPQP